MLGNLDGDFEKVTKSNCVITASLNHKITIHIKFTIHSLTIHKLTNKLTIHEFQVNLLAVVDVQEKEDQLLCITKTTDATRRVEAAAVKEALDNWGISTDTIIASSFDTTCSNTGVNSGGAVLLQQLLNRQLLWLSCRHHVAELILKAAFQSLFGNTTAPVATLFSNLKSSWSSLDLTDLHLPPTPACYRFAVDPLFSFLDERLLPDNLTEDLVPVALFNKDLEDEFGNLLAMQIGGLPPSTALYRSRSLTYLTLLLRPNSLTLLGHDQSSSSPF